MRLQENADEPGRILPCRPRECGHALQLKALGDAARCRCNGTTAARPSAKGESMTARHWMQVVALASALALTGTAVAADTDGSTSTADRSGTSSPAIDTPSSGAIVTPEDKAMGLGKAQAGNRNDDVRGDTSTMNDDTSSDEE